MLGAEKGTRPLAAREHPLGEGQVDEVAGTPWQGLKKFSRDRGGQYSAFPAVGHPSQAGMVEFCLRDASKKIEVREWHRSLKDMRSS